MHRIHPLRTTVRFRHWSRKGYAAFASLGQCVTIGQLRKNVTEQALTKQTKPSLVSFPGKQETASETEEPPTNAASLPEALLWPFLTRLPIKAASTSKPSGLLHHVQITIEMPEMRLVTHLNPSLKRATELQDTFQASLPFIPLHHDEYRRD